MDKVYLTVTVILLLSSVLTLLRAGLGPTWFDRFISLNSFTTQVVLIITVYCFATGHPEYIDIALLYALINYVGSIAIIRFFNNHSRSGLDDNA